MVISKSILQTRKIINSIRTQGKTIGFIPTMGALHAGHLALVRAARSDCDFVAVSIFVNPIQFGRNEDYSRYPRTLSCDARLLRQEKVDLVFLPKNDEIYPKDFSTYVEETRLSPGMCGIFRPGHFKGVCTIVTKLFHIIEPTIAYFGQKDFQQAAVITRMVRDLNFPLRVKIIPTVRGVDGCAHSSRNAYLTTQQRSDATILYRALLAAKKDIDAGEVDSKKIIRTIIETIKPKTNAIDYVTIVDAINLHKVTLIKGKVLIAIAAYVGATRLIDNIVVNAS